MGVEDILGSLRQIEDQAASDLAKCATEDDLASWRVQVLGKKGTLSAVLKSLGTLTAEERPVVGQSANVAKNRLEAAFEIRQAAVLEQARRRAAEKETIDVTLPGRPRGLGQTHPITQVLAEVLDTFGGMGFSVVEGPEVEWDYYNFEALNIPKDHPARDMFDTFYISRGLGSRDMLLRTHTSPMQARVMEKTKPPVRVVVPGKVYRYEATDATHESMFYQVEGLAVDVGITLADLKGTLTTFARKMFGTERKVRFRTDYFPFVEPGVDFAIDCYVCKGAGCRLCSQTGWLEILGAGMVHPKVLAGVGYDPEVYTGFAFGLGPERIAMLKYGIDDIRLFYGNDMRFLRQFR